MSPQPDVPSTAKSLRVASVQFQHAPSDKQTNLSTVEQFLRQAAEQQIQLVCFPECCITGYWHLRHLERDALWELSEAVPAGPTTQQLLQWSRQWQITIGVGLLEHTPAGDMYNAYVVTQPSGKVTCHRKLHCFISSHLRSGDTFTIFDGPNGWRIGVLICYDNNIIENVRACALAGAQLILAPHQTGGCDSGSPAAMGVIDREIWDRRDSDPAAMHAELVGDKGRGWLMRWLPARAHDNGLFYIFSNGVGPDDNEVRTGNAMILDPYGRILIETSRAGPDMIWADLNPHLRDRCTGVRWLRARRPELYQSLIVPTGQERDTRHVRFDHLAENENDPPAE